MQQTSKISLNNLYEKLDLYDSPNTSDKLRNEIFNELTNLKNTYNSNLNTNNNVLPNIRNSNFVNKILNKSEFGLNKSKKEKNVLTEIDDFILLQNQIFIKKLLSPETPYRSLLLYHNVGSGKCHLIDTPILMYDGKIKKIQDIVIGEKIMGDDSTSREVLGLVRGEDIMYEVRLSNNETFVINSDHILCLKDKLDNIVELSINDYLKLSEELQSNLKMYKNPINFEHKPIKFDAYLFGYLLNNIDKDDIINKSNYKEIVDIFLKYDLLNNKHIPEILKYNSLEIRLNILGGILDSIGILEGEQYKIKIENENFLNDVKFIGNSLGLNCYLQDKYTLIIDGNLNDIPLKNKTKIKVGVTKTKELLYDFELIKRERDNYYGLTLNKNQRYVMGNFIVTHNSCTSAHIVENFKNYYNKRALIIMQPGLQENYKKELFNITKYNIHNDSIKQCLGNEYLHQIPNRQKYESDKLNKLAGKLIRQKYEFMGYGQLGNVIEKEIEKYCKDGENPENSPKFIETLDKLFSNRVIIIDEVHNMKNSKEKDSKFSAKVLQSYILKYCKNIVLVLLSATPMYDSPEEIVWIMNTLLLNDKRKPLGSLKLFDIENNINPDFKEKLIKWANTYVSYMRSGDSKHFPDKLYPDVNNDNSILKDNDKYKFDIYGKEIKEKDNIEDLILLKCEMSEYQKLVYNNLKKQNKKILNSINLNLEEDEEIESKKNIFFDLSQISNVVFNKTNDYNESNISGNLHQLYSDTGFRTIFNSEITNDNIYKVTYKNDNYIFDKENLKVYSPKIDKIINYINNSKGIVFVYSRFLNSGIIPLAIALEHQGYSKYGSNSNILNQTKKMNIKSNNKKYMIISGNNPPVSSNYIKELEILKSDANANGDIIKVVLVTSKGIEGLDFKNIREIHIMEPWFNLSRIYQIIGRGIRYNSHICLPEKERNTTIYQYVNMIKSDKVETIDYRWYRKSELKQKKISKIERIIKESSIDCNLHKDILIHPIITKQILTSQGIEKNIEIGDIDNSKDCDYENCKLTCKPSLDLKKNKITNKRFIEYETEYTKKVVIFYMNKIKKLYFTIDEIKEFYKKNMNDNYEILYNSLYELESQKQIFKIRGVEGFLIYRSNFYIFQPLDINNSKISINYRFNNKINKANKLLLKKKENTLISTTNNRVISSNINELLNINNLVDAINVLFDVNEIDLSEVYNILIDKLSVTDRYLLLNNYKRNNNDNLEKALKSNKLFIFENNNLEAYYDIYEKGPIKFKIYNNISKCYEICNAFENSKYMDIFTKNMRNYLNNKEIDIYGFCEINKTKNKCDIKMLDKINPAPKSKGTICGFNPLNKNKLIQLIELLLNRVLKDTEKKKLKKDNLCLIYEYILRKSNKDRIKFITTDIKIYESIKNLK